MPGPESCPERNQKEQWQEQKQATAQARQPVFRGDGMCRWAMKSTDLWAEFSCSLFLGISLHSQPLVSMLAWQALQSRAVGLYMTTFLAAISLVPV
jgi:hypothetical protein